MKVKGIVLITALFSLAFGQSLDEAVEKGLRERQKAQEEQAGKEAEKREKIQKALSKCTTFDKVKDPSKFFIFYPDLLGYFIQKSGATVEALNTSTYYEDPVRSIRRTYRTYFVQVPMSFEEFLRKSSEGLAVRYEEKDTASYVNFAKGVFIVRTETSGSVYERRVGDSSVKYRAFDGVLRNEYHGFRTTKESMQLKFTFLLPATIGPKGEVLSWQAPDAVVAFKGYNPKWCYYFETKGGIDWKKGLLEALTGATSPSSIERVLKDWKGDGFGIYTLHTPLGSFDFYGELITKNSYGDLGLVFKIGRYKYICYNKKTLEELKGSDLYKNYANIYQTLLGLQGQTPFFYMVCGRGGALRNAFYNLKVLENTKDPGLQARAIQSAKNYINQAYPNILCMEFTDILCTLDDTPFLWEGEYRQISYKRPTFDDIGKVVMYLREKQANPKAEPPALSGGVEVPAVDKKTGINIPPGLEEFVGFMESIVEEQKKGKEK